MNRPDTEILFTPVHNHFNLKRHLFDGEAYRKRRSAALVEWQTLAS